MTVTPHLTQPIANLATTITRLRQMTQVDVSDRWRCCPTDLSTAEALQPTTWQAWPLASLNEKGHIAWESGRAVRWLAQEIEIPAALQDYPLEGLTLRLALTYWTDQAEVYVQGQKVQEGDLFDHSCRVLLAESVQPRQRIGVALRLVSPGHDDGALMRSRCLYEFPTALESTLDLVPVEPGFVADELEVLQAYLELLAPGRLPELARSLEVLAWEKAGDRPVFDQSLLMLRRSLTSFSDWIKQRQIWLMGHSHLDLVWLWTWEETLIVTDRTFSSVLDLQKAFPNLTFGHSSPVLYEWVQRHRPELFDQIQAKIQSGHWEVLGSTWVEPELNLLSGESLVRQVLHGQRYCLQTFGRVSPIAWLPDSFGFCWQLPQIFTQGGIKYLATQKLTWNDTTQFPYSAFWWQAPDGSRLFTWMSSAVGEQVDPVKMGRYGASWESRTGIPTALWLIGVGDHGGGPTRDMLEVAQRWQRSPLFPQIQFSTVQPYLEHLKAQGYRAGSQAENGSGMEPRSQMADFPVWQDEIYLECHRGSYTTHGDQKRWNRRCEEGLYQAELFASFAQWIAGQPYPQDKLDQAWQKVLFNQFHDILPGSSIRAVFEETDPNWEQAAATCQMVIEQSLAAIAAHIALPEPPQPNCRPVVVFNPLNWVRADRVTLAQDQWAAGTSQVYSQDGSPVLTQQTHNGSLIFWAESIPALGYQVFWIGPALEPGLEQLSSLDLSKSPVLENAALRVTIDPQTGTLTSVFDKLQQREVLSGPGNELQAFQDGRLYWDAWNIQPDYADHPYGSATLAAWQWLEQGPVRQVIQVVRKLGQSTFWQCYSLEANQPQLQIETQADWQERHTLLKVAFPLAVAAEAATYEIPCGAIARPTAPQNERDRAKWEVPALRWADLSQTDQSTGQRYGVSLLNNCKYGYDSQPSQLRLTLLRGSVWPDPEADRGHHSFTYALYPHSGDWREAETVHRGYELNQPLQGLILPSLPKPALASSTQQFLPPTASLLNLGDNSLVLMALKPAENEPNHWILRCYEAQGETTSLQLGGDLGWQMIQSVNLLEQAIAEPTPNSGSTTQLASLQESSPTAPVISPWKIVSFKVKPTITITRQ